MTGSSPQDVAVAFRSFPRRLTGLLADTDDAAKRSAAGPLVSQLEGVVRDAAGRMHVPSSGDAGAVAGAVADAIEDRPADAWTADDLDAVRSAALEGGRLLRLIESSLAD
jgi:hypothetical protein